MKKFNLESAKAGKPVCTRDGRSVRIICFDKKGSDHPIVALISLEGAEETEWYSSTGRLYNGAESNYDLMMAEVEKNR